MLPRSIQLITLKHLLCARALGWGRGDTTGFSRQGRTQEDGPSPQLQRKLLGACPVSKARDSDASRLAADAQVPIVRPLASWVLSHQASAFRGRRSAHVLRGPSPADVPRGRSCVAASTKDLGTAAPAALPRSRRPPEPPVSFPLAPTAGPVRLR